MDRHRQQNTYSALLAEIGSCQMEYKYLSHLTGRREYFTIVNAITDRMERAQLIQLRSLEAKKIYRDKIAAAAAAQADGEEDDENVAVVPTPPAPMIDPFRFQGGLGGMWGTRWDIGTGESMDRTSLPFLLYIQREYL